MDKKNILNSAKKDRQIFPNLYRNFPDLNRVTDEVSSVVFVQFGGDLTPPEHKRGKGTVMDVHEMSPWSSVHIHSNVQTKIVLFPIDVVTFLPAGTTSEHVTLKNCYRNIESSSGNCQQPPVNSDLFPIPTLHLLIAPSVTQKGTCLAGHFFPNIFIVLKKAALFTLVIFRSLLLQRDKEKGVSLTSTATPFEGAI